MSAAVQWSYSSYKTFITCPLQYKHKYVLKDVKDPGNDASRYGTAVHLALEQLVRDGLPLPDQFQQFMPMVAPVLAWRGEMHCEFKMALGFDLKPCDFWDKNYFVRGVADIAYVKGTRGRVLDWKSGKSAKYADIKQLELMALMMFKHFPQLERIDGALLFLVANKPIRATFLKSDSKAAWMRWLYEVSRMEKALELDNFGPRPNNLCRFCPVKSCEFHPDRIGY